MACICFIVAALLHGVAGEMLRDISGPTVFGILWLLLARALFRFLGLHGRDDAIERNNDASLVAHCGATMAVALMYAGGNIGEGPSYSENVFSVGIATAALAGLW